jgi:hypothetical protein
VNKVIGLDISIELHAAMGPIASVNAFIMEPKILAECFPNRHEQDKSLHKMRYED